MTRRIIHFLTSPLRRALGWALDRERERLHAAAFGVDALIHGVAGVAAGALWKVADGIFVASRGVDFIGGLSNAAGHKILDVATAISNQRDGWLSLEVPDAEEAMRAGRVWLDAANLQPAAVECFHAAPAGQVFDRPVEMRYPLGYKAAGDEPLGGEQVEGVTADFLEVYGLTATVAHQILDRCAEHLTVPITAVRVREDQEAQWIGEAGHDPATSTLTAFLGIPVEVVPIAPPAEPCLDLLAQAALERGFAAEQITTGYDPEAGIYLLHVACRSQRFTVVRVNADALTGPAGGSVAAYAAGHAALSMRWLPGYN